MGLSQNRENSILIVSTDGEGFNEAVKNQLKNHPLPTKEQRQAAKAKQEKRRFRQEKN